MQQRGARQGCSPHRSASGACHWATPKGRPDLWTTTWWQSHRVAGVSTPTFPLFPFSQFNSSSYWPLTIMRRNSRIRDSVSQTLQGKHYPDGLALKEKKHSQGNQACIQYCRWLQFME